ncbi:suppressor of fused domain protein [Rossellomorea vietnamensis]|uniref:suppressor of fused domain protein n=1 Tax=Rossellomorea vietnamensis TaxID=218284 RepID=UPI001E4E89B1|nr:suppressor of fused domain protein [Rossellomorea vietnamensis]MCC5801851.1 suppressor of fused domain protein [Rossellomorea vietnamensis]
MSVSEENKVLAKTVLNVFGGKPNVFRYWDDNKESTIDILSCEDKTYEGISSYSTIGLSDFPLGYEENKLPLRAEFVGASDFECFPNIIATCAFNIINSRFGCAYGTIFKDVVKMYMPESPVTHIILLSPYLWGDKLKSINFENKQVAWLMAIPISEEEKQYTDNNGIEALQQLFEQNQINIFDLRRNSAI